MGEMCAVELRVRLPAVLAAEVEEVQRTEPEVLQKILLYGLVRRTMFERLAARQEETPRP